MIIAGIKTDDAAWKKYSENYQRDVISVSGVWDPGIRITCRNTTAIWEQDNEKGATRNSNDKIVLWHQRTL